MSNNSMSLISLLKNDDNFQKRLAAKVGEVKQDKGKILSSAQAYSKKYEKEILEGEQLKRNLLTEGGRLGKSESEVMESYGRFCPALSTPILNWLYFLLRESGDDEVFGNGRYATRDIQDSEITHIFEEVEYNKENIREPETFDSIIYGNLTISEFQRIKKLKKLATHNTNLEESTAAFKKCKELCIAHNLEFEKIPVH